MKLRGSTPKKYERGQALIIIALSFVALLAFVGLAVDVGSLYVTYTQLKRAVDAAAVAAANNIKYPQATQAERELKITEAAREMLALHDVKDLNSLTVYLCSDSGLPADFAAMCPGAGDMPRKLAYVEATQNSPVYFLRLFGLESIPFTTSAVGEAATVDLVLVFDTSESMGGDTSGFYNGSDFNPNACNSNNSCQPLRDAKDAAKTLISLLFDGYDQVAIVTYNYEAHMTLNLTADIGDDEPWLGTRAASCTPPYYDGDALDAIDCLILLHDDAPAARLVWSPYHLPPPSSNIVFNPIFPDDRDGDGHDNDPLLTCEDLVNNNNPLILLPDLWDDTTGDPCDSDSILDAYDWNKDDDHTNDDIDHAPGTFEDTAILSTCIGCGMRVGKDVLTHGRSNSVWVMVLMSDGIVNMSDTHASYSTGIPASYKYGFCGDEHPNFWKTYCVDRNRAYTAPDDMDTTGRYCIDSDSTECPPAPAIPTGGSGPFSVEDYAMDMTDEAALLQSDNPNEPLGENIIIYSIGLGDAAGGEDLLRYMANVGDDGSRANDPCFSIPHLQACGNYYYAPDPRYLGQIFESIANRIFTKISR